MQLEHAHAKQQRAIHAKDKDSEVHYQQARIFS